MHHFDPFSVKPSLLIVDDNPVNLTFLEKLLQKDYILHKAVDGNQALYLFQTLPIDLILLDVLMPGIDGFETCRQMKTLDKGASVPILFLSAQEDAQSQQEGFLAGGTDYITKPFVPALVQARIGAHLQTRQNVKQQQLNTHLFGSLSAISRFHDQHMHYQSGHIGTYAHLLATHCGLSAPMCAQIAQSAPLHDIGNIGISPTILQKNTPLTDAEHSTIEQHTLIGARLISDHNDSALKVTKNICLHHHERYDGTGYPYKLAGDLIPIEARICAIADVFDSMLCARPWRPAHTFDQAFEYITHQRDTHFDPHLIDIFEELKPALYALYSNPNISA